MVHSAAAAQAVRRPAANDLVQQSEDVLVDTRGYIYLDDKHWGLFILRYTGPDRPKPTAN